MPAAAPDRLHRVESRGEAGPAHPLPRRGRVPEADTARVIVLDSGGYGPVTIGKTITMTAPPGCAGISAVSGGGITIAGANIQVTLRGLTIHGQGGNNGIVFSNGDSLIVGRVTISNALQEGVVIDGTIPLSASFTPLGIDMTRNGIGIKSTVDATIAYSPASYSITMRS